VFHYRHFFRGPEGLWWIEALVSDTGWPDRLWVIQLFAAEGGPLPGQEG
jgi:hypothetical protein